jgi:DNA-binding HxlR family transcriptional regulator
VWVGINRFDDLQRDLGISRRVLAERLKHLVEEGLLERRPYSERPARYEYVLTRKGFEFVDVLMVMAQWGDRWTAGDAGPPVFRRHRGCGEVTPIELRCAECGELVTSSEVDVEPGPGLTA